jgi:tetratricopeptide (TPR) repeat protein
MSRIDDPPIAAQPLSDGGLPTLSEPNQDTFRRLKLCLSLSLRRQVFLAICDDLALRNALAGRLAADLAQSTLAQSTLAQATPTSAVLISLDLDFANPNPIAQITQWVKHATTTQQLRNGDSLPSFQILGIEGLTRKSAGIQKRFLDHLQHIGNNPTGLDSSLILWLTRPWFRMAQSSAPAFWQAHTGLFQFEGDPTPAPSDPAPAPVVAVNLGQPRRSAPNQAPNHPPRRALWELLADDLEQFDEPIQAAALEEFDEPLLHLDKAADRVLDVAPILLSDTGWVPPPYLAQAEDPAPATPEENRGLDAVPRVPVDSDQSRIIRRSSDIDRDWVDQIRASLNSPAHPLPWGTDTAIVQLLQEIEQLHTQGAQPTAFAIAYRTLGNLYRDGIEQGYTSEANLRLTILTYEHAWKWLETTSPEWADVLNDMGNLYWMLSRQSADPTMVQLYLEQGIAAYDLALTQVDAQAYPHSYAMLHNNLGSAYGDLARYRDPAVALQQAVQSYAESLRYRSPNEDPARYAATQNNLGTAYWNLAQHEQPVPRLQQAIAAYMEAIRYYSPEREPLHYAMIQNNLGTAYWNLAQQISPGKKDRQTPGKPDQDSESVTARDLLLHAITVYRDALTYRTLAIAPTAHAATQNNLGTAFWNLAILPDTEPELKQETLEWAIAAYTDALTAIHQLVQQSQDAQLTFDRYATHNNLGLAHYHLATAKQSSLEATPRSQHLEAALQNHLQALRGWTHQPDYATTATGYILQTVRAFYTHFGMKGQSIALSQIPAALLPELMRKL